MQYDFEQVHHRILLKRSRVFSPCLRSELSSTEILQEVSSKVMSLVAEGPTPNGVTWGELPLHWN